MMARTETYAGEKATERASGIVFRGMQFDLTGSCVNGLSRPVQLRRRFLT